MGETPVKTNTQHAAGDRVSQPQYGTGTVTYANEYHTVIEFDDGRKTTFVTTRVELTPSDTPAPVKPKRAVRKKKVVAPVVVPEPIEVESEVAMADADELADAEEADAEVSASLEASADDEG